MKCVENLPFSDGKVLKHGGALDARETLSNIMTKIRGVYPLLEAPLFLKLVIRSGSLRDILP